ncbi:MAG: hypothetical protein HY701_05860 [Gemmatimonadetes bacterium]|nr:hypothetical protein [Gemmatimonadota bacterium]
MKILERTRILIVGDKGSVLEFLQGRIDFFWPPDIPGKTTAVFCAWADEAIEAIKEYEPEVLLLNYAFRADEMTGKDVARWIDRNYRAPIRVAAYSERPDEDLRELFKGTECVKHFILGDRVKEFVEECTRKEKADGD